MWTFDSTAVTFDNNTTAYTFDGGQAGLYQGAGASASLGGALTNWARVTLLAPLLGGIGSALDPYLWTTPFPGVGTTLYYDSANMTIGADGTIVATSDNFQAVIQFMSPARVWAYAVYIAQPTPVTYLQGGASFSSELSGGSALFSQAAGAVGGMTADLATGIPLVQGLGAVGQMGEVFATGALFATSFTSVAGFNSILATGALLQQFIGIRSGASATLSTGIPLGAAVRGISKFSATLTGAIVFRSQLAATSRLASSLTNGPRFTQGVTVSAGMGASLLTGIALAGTASGIGALSGALVIAKPLKTATRGLASFRSALSTGAGFKTRLSGVSGFSASLLTGVELSSMLGAVASFPNNLLTVEVLTVPVLVSHQIPGIYEPGALPEGQFPLSVGEKSYYGIDWTYWLSNKWQPGYSAPLNYVVRPYPWTGLEYICTTAGATGAAQPVWSTEAGGITVDGTAGWTAQAIGNDSLLDSVVSASWAAPAGITVTGYLPVNNFTPVLIDGTLAVAGTTYLVECVVTLTSGEFLIGKLYMDVY